MQIKHGNVSAMGNSARGFKNTLEDTQREGRTSRHQVGLADPTLASAGPCSRVSCPHSESFLHRL